jgi:hypothetical protein
MKSQKLGWGACLAVIGTLSIVLGPTLGLTELGRPWNFLLGFVFGVVAGLGAALSVAGLLEVRLRS